MSTDTPHGIHVDLIDQMGDDLTVVNTARVSFAHYTEQLGKRDEKLIRYLARHRHTSPFRAVMLTLRCQAPIFLARQLQKHVVGFSQWNETSRRYVDTLPALYIFDGWRARPDASIKQGSDGVLDADAADVCERAYRHTCEAALASYKQMLRAGAAPEQARAVLPQSMLTEWIWTGSLQAYQHLYALRSDDHAQHEAQLFAAHVGAIMARACPLSWAALNSEETNPKEAA